MGKQVWYNLVWRAISELSIKNLNAHILPPSSKVPKTYPIIIFTDGTDKYALRVFSLLYSKRIKTKPANTADYIWCIHIMKYVCNNEEIRQLLTWSYLRIDWYCVKSQGKEHCTYAIISVRKRCILVDS